MQSEAGWEMINILQNSHFVILMFWNKSSMFSFFVYNHQCSNSYSEKFAIDHCVTWKKVLLPAEKPSEGMQYGE
jgi:hypothetical protein